MDDTDVIRKHIELKDYGGGARPRIVGSRIRVMDVVAWHIRQGMSIDQMVEGFPHITRADFHAALAYYWDNKEEIDQAFADDRIYVEEMTKGQISPLQEKLKQTRSGQS
jgi:uncharacterized protein (DUF433 family)